ncbi:MAG: hypothetical protein F6K22_07945 [Okeania sp. SIO2F4]|uniref:hypothetical protein n=1 Tax=Okeania sp. SIO2F4 TaxID=2607790 RepID=UPI00142C73B3|nr:hypothetical protein [Okeania sp. SIO2F4]NES02783.1 hypothetical protein [Okeania sp. SIO2F4]
MGINRLAWYLFVFIIGFASGYLLNLLPQISWHFLPLYGAIVWTLKELQDTFGFPEMREAAARSLNPKLSVGFFTLALIILRAGIIAGSITAWF